MSNEPLEEFCEKLEPLDVAATEAAQVEFMPSVKPGIVLFALAMGGFAIGTTEFASMSLLPNFARDLGVSEPTAGHAISAYALGVVIGAPIIAVLTAKLPRKLLLIGLMIMMGLANTLSGLVLSFDVMLLCRFLSGLPHGAYFGVAALVAASLVPQNKRAKAVAQTMLGLTVATIIGVPLANWLGQAVGWRWGFGLVGLIALTTVILISLYAPNDPPHPDASPLRELTALKRPQVWLTLGIGAIGFGGVFAVYTFLASTLLQVTQAPPGALPFVFGIFGVGMTVGTLVAAHLADRALMPTACGILLWSAAALALYSFATHNIWLLGMVMFLVGNTGGLGTVLQTRLMDVAGDAQTLAAALNHSAFNFANALGPFLAGLAVSAGWGFPATGWVGCSLALGGWLIWLVSWLTSRHVKAKV